MIKNIIYFKIFITLALAVLSYSSFAGDSFLEKGFILNDRGTRCWYTQKIELDSKYFYTTVTGKMGTMIFDDPRCMSEADVGLDINKKMINNVITGWYSHSDAAFQTSVQDLFPSSMLQKQGLCIQSKKYPIIGVLVDYEIKNNSIIRVRHGRAGGGCIK
ncbi:hypothetical protein [Nitrosomonas communis]|uniref:hypothetical protein n=1 Tax=Nitrosomonas communis TaxID=44574 RepID=UPI003D2B2955